jgi:uncharacterized protein (TIGR00369 family)
MAEPSLNRSYLTIDSSPLARKLGIRCRDVGDDYAEYQLDFDQSNTTVGDLVHGGALLALADCAATGAAWSRVDDPQDYRGITVDLSLSFLGPARSADLLAKATVDRRGGTLCFCTVDIRTAQEQPVARGQVVYKLQRKRAPADVMAGLFAGRSAQEQMEILAELEKAGADLYRVWAESSTHQGDERELLDAAEREDANARMLSHIAGRGPQ